MLSFFWQENWNLAGLWDTTKLPTEDITVEGVQYRVPRRFDHSLEMQILFGYYMVSITRGSVGEFNIFFNLSVYLMICLN